MTSKPFSLRIFVADGDPDGLRIVERSNWVGRSLVFPRAAWAQPSVADLPELQQTGVYLLLGPREDGEGDRLYIGEGDPIKPRLASHHSGTSQKDFWTRAICFVSMGQALNKAHVQFLEANLIRLAKHVPLDVENKKNETEPTLSQADRADMQVFLAHMLGMLPVLGVHAFEQPPQAPAPSEPELICKGKGLMARGYESTQGFVVKAGSQAASSMAKNLPRMVAKRQELIDLGVLAPQGNTYEFAQDYAFSSPSPAACVVLGRSANGRLEWKDAEGQSLKVLQGE